MVLTLIGPERRDRRMDENDGTAEAAKLKLHDPERGDEKIERAESNAESEEKPKETAMEDATTNVTQHRD